MLLFDFQKRVLFTSFWTLISFFYRLITLSTLHSPLFPTPHSSLSLSSFPTLLNSSFLTLPIFIIHSCPLFIPNSLFLTLPTLHSPGSPTLSHSSFPTPHSSLFPLFIPHSPPLFIPTLPSQLFIPILHSPLFIPHSPACLGEWKNTTTGSSPRSSVADPECFDADPDPTFHADVDPAPNPDQILLARKRKQIFFQIFNTFSESLQNLSCVIFSVTMGDEG